jgi:membrane fusion protein (multidrug efflux system)
MFARITAVFGERENARVIPEEAIVPQGARQFVIRLVDGPDQDTKIAQRVEVKVGIRQPGRVEIVEGLQLGDVVVTAGQQRIQKDGMPVRVLELNRAPPGVSPAEQRGGRRRAAPGAAAAASGVQPAAVGAGPGIPAALAAQRTAGPNPCGAVAVDTPPPRGSRPASRA